MTQEEIKARIDSINKRTSELDKMIEDAHSEIWNLNMEKSQLDIQLSNLISPIKTGDVVDCMIDGKLLKCQITYVEADEIIEEIRLSAWPLNKNGEFNKKVKYPYTMWIKTDGTSAMKGRKIIKVYEKVA